MRPSPYISLRKVRKSYGKKAILRGVELDILEGEILALVGPSGSGKSTVLRSINRLIEIDSGEICVEGRHIGEYEPAELRRKVVLMPQNSVMFPGTAMENVLFPLRAHGLDEGMAEKALLDAGVPEELFDREAGKLSGGEKKRVALARAIALRPGALLLDEPTAGVDPKKVQQIEAAILDMVSKRNLTVVWVTHDTQQALRIGERIASIKDGKVMKVGKRDEFAWEGVY